MGRDGRVEKAAWCEEMWMQYGRTPGEAESLKNETNSPLWKYHIKGGPSL